MKQLKLYEDCISFWQRMGIKKEDNLIALSSLDVLNAFQDKTNVSYKIPYYIERGKKLIKELSLSKYDNNRGRENWLLNFNF